MSRSIAASALLLTLFAPGTGFAEDAARLPRGSYVRIDRPVEQTHNSKIIYLNPCWGGCTITPGDDNSITNRSSIPYQTSNLSQFNAGQTAWNAVVQCVQAMYEPFDIEVTDQDPSPANHFEAMVAGTPQQVGMSSGVGGVSPFTCGVINNAITYTFANIYGGSVQAICEVVAQETAHAFGLDHEFLCQDPMTYLYGCGDKSFQDVDARCGEDQARNCSCGGSTQNSVQRILAVFGPGNPTPPTVAITEPADGAQVQAGYVVRANITDNVSVEYAELWINNQYVMRLTNPPWAFNATADLLDGTHTVEVRAFDNQDVRGTGTIHVTQGEPCESSDDCGPDLACVDGGCVPGGDLGETCTGPSDCASGLCLFDGTNNFCTWPCETSCTDGFGCQDGYCMPGADNPDVGGGCRTGRGDAPIWAGLLLGAALLGLRRRRHSRR